MRRLYIVALFLLCSTTLNAQILLSEFGGGLSMAVTPSYQSWKLSANQTVSQISVPVRLTYTFSRNFSAALRVNQASFEGDGVQKLNGTTDTRLIFNYKAGESGLIFNAGIGIPSGKTGLSEQEFESYLYITSPFLDFRVPGFGQGTGLSVGALWLKALSENFAIGLGSSFNYKGQYEPIADLTYQPGNEVVLTAGFDLKITRTSSVSLDVTGTRYGDDQINSSPAFTSGNKWLTNFQFRKFFGFHELRLFGRHRTRGDNLFLGADSSLIADGLMNPNQSEAHARLRLKMSRAVHAALIAMFRHHEASSQALVDGRVWGFGLQPAFRMGRNLTTVVSFMLIDGNTSSDQALSGYEVSIGLNWLP